MAYSNFTINNEYIYAPIFSIKTAGNSFDYTQSL